MQRKVVNKCLLLRMFLPVSPILNTKVKILNGHASDDPKDCKEITDVGNDDDELEDA